MDFIFAIHLLLQVILLSIPLWSLNYLKYGVYIPLLISTIWLFFNGCPLTKVQSIESNSFTFELLKNVFPDITTQYVDHIIIFAFLLITVVSFHRLCKSKSS
jgi:uncharacterized membrane protein YkvI